MHLFFRSKKWVNKQKKKTSILVIYTGGTIGMVQHPQSKSLIPVKFDKIQEFVPELKKYDFIIKVSIFSNRPYISIRNRICRKNEKTYM